MTERTWETIQNAKHSQMKVEMTNPNESIMSEWNLKQSDSESAPD